MTPITIKLYGDQARKLTRALKLIYEGDSADINMKVTFTKKPANGRSKIEIIFNI